MKLFKSINKFLPFTIIFFTSLSTAHADFIKGVTYFGDAWPINFWNSDLSKVDQDFKKIKKEGFNTVTVVVPWGEFQPQIAPEKFNEESFERLQQVCEKAKSNDLKFFMRVSYLWDMYPKVQKPNYERFSEIFSNASTKQSWSNYLSRISSVTKDCASGAFISWEDYWNTIDRIKSATSPENRKYLSDYYGFNKWMKIKYPKCKEKCINFVDNGFYYLPTKDSPDFRFVYEWFDDQITKSLLPILANYFDSASVEVRVDDDPIFEGDKIIDWYSHKSTYVINSSEYVFTYWAPAMGAQNIGEKNSAKEVIDRFSWINNKISAATNNKIIIAQLLFEDNTPSAINNAVIRENEKGQFFKSLAKPLVLETSGYMLWGGKDYHANMIFNPSFAIDLDGWRINEKSKIKFITKNKRKFLKIYRGAILEQNILAASNHFKGASKKNFFRLSGEGAAQIEISYAGKSIVIRTSSKYENYNINFPSAIIDSLLKIDVKSGSFKIDSLNLYPFTTIANFKNVYGEAGVRHQNIIELNGNISHTAEALQEISMTEESLANVKGVYGIEGNDEKKFVWASSIVKTKIFTENPIIRINGYLPEETVKKKCNIEIYANKNIISKQSISRGSYFSINSKLPSSVVGNLVDFTFNSDCRIKSSKDKRDLSYILNGIKNK